MLRSLKMSSTIAGAALAAATLLSAAPPASAGPLCSTLSGLTVATFTSCVVENAQDSLTNVQNALTGVFAPNPAPTLIPGESYYPTNDPPGKAGEPFTADVPGLFEFTQIDTHTFQFDLLPPGTEFLTIKQADDFEIFNVTGLTTPFQVIHQIEQPGFSHFSTFAADGSTVPEPASMALLGTALLGFGILRHRKRA